MTRIRVTRTGGFAGVRLSADVDDPGEVARILAGLRQVVPASSGAVRDDFTYEFEVLDDGAGQARGDVVAVPGSTLPASLREVARDLVTRARPAR